MVACVDGGSAFGFGRTFDGWILRITDAARKVDAKIESSMMTRPPRRAMVISFGVDKQMRGPRG